jgi:hypothetical protein
MVFGFGSSRWHRRWGLSSREVTVTNEDKDGRFSRLSVVTVSQTNGVR